MEKSGSDLTDLMLWTLDILLNDWGAARTGEILTWHHLSMAKMATRSTNDKNLVFITLNLRLAEGVTDCYRAFFDLWLKSVARQRPSNNDFASFYLVQ